METTFKDEMNSMMDSITWTFEDNITVGIDQMTTGRIFNAMRALYNYVAVDVGLHNIWPQESRYNWCAGIPKEIKIPKKELTRMLKDIVIFIYVIEQRQDLPDNFRKPYQAIICSILDALNIPYGDTMLPDMWKLLPERATCE